MTDISIFPFKPGDIIHYVYPNKSVTDLDLSEQDRDDRDRWLLRNRFVGNEKKISVLYGKLRKEPIIGLVVFLQNCGPLGDVGELQKKVIWEMHLLIGEDEFYVYLSPEEAEECFDIATMIAK